MFISLPTLDFKSLHASTAPAFAALALGVAALTASALGVAALTAFGPTVAALTAFGPTAFGPTVDRFKGGPLSVGSLSVASIPLRVLCLLYCYQAALRCRSLDQLKGVRCALCLHQFVYDRRTSSGLI